MSTHFAPFDPRERLPARNHIADGLWQGQRPATYQGFHLVVSCEKHLAKGPMAGFDGVVIHVPMEDTDEFVIDGFAVSVAAHAVALALRRDKRVLVHCTGGINRSSVITVRALEKRGMSTNDAIILLRAQRDKWCLCNKNFERWLTGDYLPTKETSAFRGESDVA